MKHPLILIPLALLLASCSSLDTTPPVLAITSPSVGSSVVSPEEKQTL